jgi:hypothetical protein
MRTLPARVVGRRVCWATSGPRSFSNSAGRDRRTGSVGRCGAGSVGRGCPMWPISALVRRSGQDPVLCSALDIRVDRSEMTATSTQVRSAAPGALILRRAPAGLPDVVLHPPTIAESGDPFAIARILSLVARLQRDRPTRLDDLVAALNGAHLDWLFDRRVVADTIVTLQATTATHPASCSRMGRTGRWSRSRIRPVWTRGSSARSPARSRPATKRSMRSVGSIGWPAMPDRPDRMGRCSCPRRARTHRHPR